MKKISDKKNNGRQFTEKVLVVKETNDYLVLNKPAGMVVNPSETTKSEITLQDWIIDYLKISNFQFSNDQTNNRISKSLISQNDQFNLDKKSKIKVNYSSDEEVEKSFNSRAGIVHRLDRETSGIILVAKNFESFKSLQKQFYDRVIEKEYIALVYGEISAFSENESIVIDAPIGRNPKSREKHAVLEGGRRSVTVINQIKVYDTKNGPMTLVKCHPKTGRTHQIRVHLTALGNPIAGDKLYSGKKRNKINADLYIRQMLHASRIVFIEPNTYLSIKNYTDNDKIEIVQELPNDFKDLLAKIK